MGKLGKSARRPKATVRMAASGGKLYVAAMRGGVLLEQSRRAQRRLELLVLVAGFVFAQILLRTGDPWLAVGLAGGILMWGKRPRRRTPDWPDEPVQIVYARKDIHEALVFAMQGHYLQRISLLLGFGVLGGLVLGSEEPGLALLVGSVFLLWPSRSNIAVMQKFGIGVPRPFARVRRVRVRPRSGSVPKQGRSMKERPGKSDNS